MRPRFFTPFTACLAVLLAGCSVMHIPNYIKDENPYKRTFYAPYDRVNEVTVLALLKHGWSIEGENNPALFERSRDLEGVQHKQTLLYTHARKFSFGLGTRFSRMNAYLRTTEASATEVELRTVTITTTSVKTFYDYKNDPAVDAIFKTIDELLAQPQ